MNAKDDGIGHIPTAAELRADLRALVAQLKVENAQLRALLGAALEDTARLDWLDRNAQIRDRTLAIMERDGPTLRWAGVEWDGSEETIRAAIAAARKLTEGKP